MSLFDDSEICRGILESLPSGVCVVDGEKKIVFWSDGAERITGHLRHEVTGHSCISEALLHCDQAGCEFCHEDCPAASAMKLSHSVETVGFLHHKNGYEVPVRIRAVPVHNQHGSIIGAVETFEELQHATHPNARDRSSELPGSVDEVTGVASQVLMQSHLRRALATFVEHQVPFAVLALRLEGLAHFRASLGPEAGSSLLRVIARSLENTLWTTDVVGRWTDVQFLVILNGCDAAALSTVRERMRGVLAGDAIEWWGERRTLPVTMGEAAVQAGDDAALIMGRAQKSLEASAEAEANATWRTQAAAASSAATRDASPNGTSSSGNRS
jgi:diguanylate cyclase (GGDEF)-like protein/PAS domain S-box-containing protein